MLTSRVNIDDGSMKNLYIYGLLLSERNYFIFCEHLLLNFEIVCRQKNYVNIFNLVLKILSRIYERTHQILNFRIK